LRVISIYINSDTKPHAHDVSERSKFMRVCSRGVQGPVCRRGLRPESTIFENRSGVGVDFFKEGPKPESVF